MSAKCTQEVMRYLKGSRWSCDRALRKTHGHTHGLNELQVEVDMVQWKSNKTPSPPFISSPRPFPFTLLSSASLTLLEIKPLLLRSGLLWWVKQASRPRMCQYCIFENGCHSVRMLVCCSISLKTLNVYVERVTKEGRAYRQAWATWGTPCSDYLLHD